MSANRPRVDVLDDTACDLSVAEVTKNARRSFERWWEAVPQDKKRSIDGPFAWTMYKMGYLAMARELGRPPAGGAV
ncbi:hypothetical protein J5N58_16885 [Rhizobium cremeum]|uniref:hypothetical protein n=1 Tax=Rhizobium cremeum TaxID=2813827 RepID=UPI001FD0800C|nr:hypothetical protein [Rhizobium cremeum]MCJ7996096.1 hypothetical protein [Rhizobium cremeum]MCJ8001355.1 hypothetical protein [Rhizobium cremeum]